jgi:hypothetical protein
MEANFTNEKPFDLSSIKGLVDQFFIEHPNTAVKEELWKWFIFSVSTKGLTISDLPECELPIFFDQLIKLIEAVYKWANHQKAVIKKEGGATNV